MPPPIHPTAILTGDVSLAPGVSVGPHCVLDASIGPVTVGPGTKLVSHVCLTGPLTLGARNTLYPFVCLGFAPQDLKWDPQVPGAGLVIGDGNVFREQVTIHRATSHETPTLVGDNNYFMACSHAGHDCTIGSHCIFANSVLLAGFVRVDDRVTAGGNATIHQFCRIGRGCMLSGTMGLSMDLPPFLMLTAGNVAGSLNLIGMRRSGMPRADIDTVRWIYRILYRSGLSPRQAVELLQPRAADPLVREYIDFITSSKRGICPAVGKSIRGTAAATPIHDASD